MIIPEKISIFGMDFTITLCESYEDNPNFMGKSIEIESKLIINNKMNEAQILSTLLHEIIHTIAYKTGIKLSERDVLSLESGLMDVLIHNQAFFKSI